MNGSISLRFEQVTPLFFGRVEELSPTEFVRSYSIPSAYTVGGATMTLLSEVAKIELEEIENKVRNREIVIRATYFAAKFGNSWRYFIPAPLSTSHGRIYKVIVAKGKYSGFCRISGIPSAGIPPISDFKPDGKNWLIEVSFDDEKRRWQINTASLAELNPRFSDRTSFEMERVKRTVKAPSLYFRELVEGYEIYSFSYGKTRDTRVACDILLPTDLKERLRMVESRLIRFGGESGLVRAHISDETPLNSLCRKGVEKDEIYLAISHIPIIRKGDKFSVLGFGRADWIFGRVELMGGWLMREEKPKDMISVLSPGSLFKISSVDESYDGEWYLKLLSTAVSLKGVE
ncbi:MAG: hypothetical protein DSO07_08735 [Thermoproteota archaeon]|jgi:hypothetical protein|uniref:Type III-B CRISPR module-associated protein Cmr3 n=1 Tax=Candidatus Methanodesulfokora washburnensis TaxID=2478471 RepID=A0A3R9PJ97_9CREN|nr:hypothetical protein [Candidatus Methanodesulfokores washburnensis]RSN74973.1 hypothetical protein D6D85_07075 [Candidatus Methanodesulfokores washburnensis]TDA40639.1 MAG: hypothetical protein DSO07_08735 [Candidatus Korarchaeota archaeon]